MFSISCESQICIHYIWPGLWIDFRKERMVYNQTYKVQIYNHSILRIKKLRLLFLLLINLNKANSLSIFFSQIQSQRNSIQLNQYFTFWGNNHCLLDPCIRKFTFFRLQYCNDDHLPYWNLSKRTTKPLILSKNLKIIIECMTWYWIGARLIENNFSTFFNFKIDFTCIFFHK